VACVIDLRGHGEHSLSLDGAISADLDVAIRFCRLFWKVTVIGHSLGGMLALLSNADYRIAFSPPLSRTFNKHTQETLIAHRSYRVRSADPAYIFTILKELPVWDPIQDIENTLVFFAEWDIPEIISSCIAIKKVGAHVVQIPKSMHNDIFLVEKTFADVRNKTLEWYDKESDHLL
jgi:Alpha/beta hydrolase family